jgi:uncharacterized phage infection (PIP) family protein YhgE
MTTTDEVLDSEAAEAVELDTEETGETGETGETEAGKPRDRDFSKVRELHKELAEYVNTHSGLDPITPNQVKALLYLRPDFNNTPEQAQKRAERKARKEAEDARYKGLTDEQKKARKAAERATEQANKMAERARQAQADADRLLAQANSGEDIAAKVESVQAASSVGTAEGSDDTPDKPKRGIGRRNR